MRWGRSSRLLPRSRPRPQRAAVSRLQRLKERTSPCPQLQQAACSLQALKGDGRSRRHWKTWRSRERFPRTSFRRSGFCSQTRFSFQMGLRLHTIRQSFDPSITAFPICPPPLSTSCLRAPPLSSTCVPVLSRSRDPAKTSSKLRHQRGDGKVRPA